MKKLLVVLLSVLLLFSFTSCKKDKSEEIKADYEAKIKAQQEKNEELVKNFEDFMDAYEKDISEDTSVLRKILVNCYDYDDLFRFQSIQGNVNVTLSEGHYPRLELMDFKDYLSLEEGEHFTASSIVSDPAPSGSVTGTATATNNFNLDYDENKVTFKYDVQNDTSTVKSNQTFEVTIDGYFKEETTDAKHVVDYDITINGTRYQLSYTYDKTTKQVTAASVNGKDVEIRLINAEDADIVVK